MSKTSENLSRRSLMTGAPMVAIAAALPFAPAVARSVSPVETVTGDPSLLELGAQIDPLLNAYRRALRRKLEARATAENRSPPLPDELVWQRSGAGRIAFAGCTERETDVEGNPVWQPNHKGADGKTYATPSREIFKADLIKDAVERGNLPAGARSKIGKRVRKLIGIAEKYEAGRKGAIEASGIEAAADEVRWAAGDIQSLAYTARNIEPVAAADVLIFARLLAAFSEAERAEACGWEGRAGAVLGSRLADAVLRIADKSGVVS